LLKIKKKITFVVDEEEKEPLLRIANKNVVATIIIVTKG
jgi:hypothetical protein